MKLHRKSTRQRNNNTRSLALKFMHSWDDTNVRHPRLEMSNFALQKRSVSGPSVQVASDRSVKGPHTLPRMDN